MNPNFLDQALHDEYEAMFKDLPVAWDFIGKSCEYYECVDDNVDEPVTTSSLRKLTSLACIYYSHSYWQEHRNVLYLVDRMIHCQYFDSVEWEQAPYQWKRQHAKILSHPAVNMVFAVILIELGQEALDKFSSRFREHAHKLHLEDTI